MTSLTLWTIIFVLGIGSFLLRFSFLGLVGNRPLPAWMMRHLRYTAVAIIPALVAPVVVWSQGPGSELDPVQIVAAAAVVLTGYVTRNTFLAIIAGVLAMALGLSFTG